MGMTIVEKIFSNKLGRTIKHGESAFVPVDYAMGTDGTIPLAIEEFKKINVSSVCNPEKIIFINDHFVPANNIESANTLKYLREFAQENGIKHFFEVGRGGICHVVVPELGMIESGDIVVGADSHTVTYGALGAFSTGIGSTDFACVMASGVLWFRVPETIKVVFSGKINKDVMSKDMILYLISRLGVEGANYCVLEFYGNVISEMSMSERFTLCNMVVEMGAKAAIIPTDEVTEEYYQSFHKNIEKVYHADEDANYRKVIEVDVGNIYPAVACPYLPSNVKWVKDLEDIKIDQVVIGSCTNGRIEDFRVACRVIKGKRFHPNTKVIIIPGSQKVFKAMIDEGILNEFVKAGAIISPSTCGVCMGGHMGVLADGEVGLFTTNRNFYGRSGHKNSKVYLCNPAVAAASALEGKITLP